MTTMGEYKMVNISNILNYAENPRHDIGTNDIDTIKKLINKVGSQYMYNLAKDIYENGLLGSNLPTLVFNKEKNKYIVYEGNRRIACLKFLNNPEILNSINKDLKQRIENLKAKKSGKYSTNIYCYITNEQEALLIMERTHSGEDKGRGLKAWNPKEKSVFESRLKQKNPIALIITELTEKFLNEDLIEKIKFTTIQRFFNNREVKKALEIDEKNISKITKEKILLINFLIDKAIEESKKQGVALTRLFNRAREIEDFFLPLIEEYKDNLIKKDNDESKVHNESINSIEEKTENPTKNADQTTIIKQDDKDDIVIKEQATSNVQNTRVLKISLIEDSSNQTYYTNQTIDLLEKLKLNNKELFKPELLVIECEELNIVNGIIQPGSMPGEYIVTYKYFMDRSRELVYWQDSLTIELKPEIKPKKSSNMATKPVLVSKTILSKEFFEKYYNRLQFDHSEKIRSLMCFLAREDKNGRYSFFINIVSRMFLEYTFRMFASKVLKEDNQSIEEKSKSLQSFIDFCCNEIEKKSPRDFVKHIQRGRKDATKKLDILQKSIHYFDVTISNDDIQVMFKNLNKYLEYVYDKILEEQN